MFKRFCYSVDSEEGRNHFVSDGFESEGKGMFIFFVYMIT